MKIYLPVAAILMFVFSAYANEEYPYEEFTYGTQENAALKSKCEPPLEGVLSCKFLQLSVLTGQSELDLEEINSEINEYLSDENRDLICEKIKPLFDYLETFDPNDPFEEIPGHTEQEIEITREWLKELSEHPLGKQEDQLEGIKHMANFCANPTKDTAKALVMAERDIESKTCQVVTREWKEDFERSADGKKWIATSDPGGTCGLIQISVFEQVNFIGSSQAWVYTTRNVITNKEAEIPMGLKCSEMDEGTYFFDWKSEERFMGCDYVTLMMY